MMNRLAGAACAVLLLGVPAAAPAQTVSGVVVEDSARTPVHGALVEVAVPGGAALQSMVTDSAGQFLIHVRPGRYAVRWSHPFYGTRDSLLVELRREDTARLFLPLSVAAVRLEPVVVRTHDRLGGFRDRLGGGSGRGRFVTREQIEARPGARASDLLREIPGVTLVPVRRGMSAASVNMIALRGGRGLCSPTIYVDGSVMRQFGESGVDDFLRPGFLEGVEVYVGGTAPPPELPALDGCGVVAFWTRSMEDAERFSWARLRNGLIILAVMAGTVLLAR
jgi:hypothetical protein